MKTELKTSTCGRGYWSRKVADVNIVKIELFGKYDELRAYFDKDWDTNKDGLIYTDNKWIKTFRAALVEKYNLSTEQAAAIDYSEQGMQGDNYVSMDVKAPFLTHSLAEQIRCE